MGSGPPQRAMIPNPEMASNRGGPEPRYFLPEVISTGMVLVSM